MIVRRSTRTHRLLRRLLPAALMAWAGVFATQPAVASTAPASAAPASGGPQASYRTQELPGGVAIASAASVDRDHDAGDADAHGASTTRTTRIDLRPDRRFSLAALRWATSEPIAGRMRAQGIDGSWTAWSELEREPTGDDGVAEGTDRDEATAARARTRTLGKQGSTAPLWTGPARRLQIDLAGARPRGLRAAFVDVTGSSPAAPRPTATAARARQDPAMAGINPRAAWDPNNACKPRGTPSIGSVEAVTVHHTAGSNDYTQEQVPAVMLAICKFHRNGNGWNDVGYNVLVDKFGGAWEGRAGGLTNAVIGAHAQGFNSVSAGISMIGDHSVVPPSPATVATVARVAAWKLAVSGKPQSGTVALTSAGGSLSRFGAGKIAVLPRVFAHRDVGQTACSGDAGYAIMDGVRATVAGANPSVPATLPAAPAPAPPPIKITISTKRRVDVGASTVVTGTARQGAAPLKGAPLALQVGEGEKWTTVATAKTDTAGKYRFARKFSRSWKLRVARTDGDSASTEVPLAVVPKLTLTVPKRLVVNKKIQLRGTIAPGRGPVSLTVERRASTGRYVKGKTLPVRMRGRVITVNVTPHSLALYRFQLVYAGSSLAAPAKSPLVFGRVVAKTTGGGASLSG